MLVAGEVSDSDASALPAQIDHGTLTIEPLRPMLSIATSNDFVVLSWSAVAPGFVLQAAEHPAAVTSWQKVPNAPAVNGDQRTVVLPRRGGAQFYRLLRP